MAVQNITQLRRIVFRKWDASDNSWDVFTLEADDLGQDTVMSINVAPRMRSRASSLGTSETAISGTFDSFAGSGGPVLLEPSPGCDGDSLRAQQ